jgi:uncharacterized membrane protein
MDKASKKSPGNIFLRMHPLQRIMLSLGITLLAFFTSRNMHLDSMLRFTLLWDVFAAVFIISSWIIFFTRPVSEIKKLANKEDGSKLFVMISIIISSFASMFAVLLLVISKEQPAGQEALTVILAVTGMVVSWIMIHTIFTFHYAHMYYFTGKDDTPDDEALGFPVTKDPDYIDFAYFSFVIGMTFQVSDVEINSRIIRRTALAHALLAFALNTFVVALTINLIAGLKK